MRPACPQLSDAFFAKRQSPNQKPALHFHTSDTILANPAIVKPFLPEIRKIFAFFIVFRRQTGAFTGFLALALDFSVFLVHAPLAQLHVQKNARSQRRAHEHGVTPQALRDEIGGRSAGQTCSSIYRRLEALELCSSPARAM